MSGFIENRSSEASEYSGAPSRMLTWHASRAMLPLVGQIAQEIARVHERLVMVRPELADLERRRRDLGWPERARRYRLEEEIAKLDLEFRAVVAELEGLGVALLDPVTGLVGFPTVVNDRRAFFTWKPGEESLTTWSYAGDLQRRPVPSEWMETVREVRVRRPRTRKK
ncbi:MAG: DUF2203 family protein [Gemmataceae bacterium]